jgi:hypothetical protein
MPPKKQDEEEKTPKQERLPGTEDPQIAEIEDLAGEYATLRDKRIRLLGQEVEKKASLLAVMKRLKRKTYQHGSITVEVVPEGEKVKVRIKEEE